MLVNKEKADKAINFIESLKHVRGNWAGRRFLLEIWQKEIVGKFFGAIDAYGARQYKSCYLGCPRKNGISTLNAAIALDLLFEEETKTCIYTIGMTEYQADIVFAIAAGMVQQNSELSKKCKIKWSYKEIVNLECDKSYKAIGIKRDSSNEYKIYDLPMRNFHEYIQDLNEKKIKDSTLFRIIYAADKKDDWTDPKIWGKANPNLGVTITKNFLKERYEMIKDKPECWHSFKQLHLNQWN